jgi:hypothetical protein
MVEAKGRVGSFDGKLNVATTQQLPLDVFDRAINHRLDIERQRIEGCYVRQRAVFAEALVAALLPGAEMVENPTAAWDVEWNPHGRPLTRIQVKCSGGWIPRYPNRVRESPPRWDFKEPSYGLSPEYERLVPGHHCETFVFARHTGRDIKAGWSFYVLPTIEVEKSGRIAATAEQLRAMGAKHCEPNRLAATIRGLLPPSRPSSPRPHPDEPSDGL